MTARRSRGRRWGAAGGAGSLGAVLALASAASCKGYHVVEEEHGDAVAWDGWGKVDGRADAAEASTEFDASDGATYDALDASDAFAVEAGFDGASPCRPAPPSNALLCDDFDDGVFGAVWDTPVDVMLQVDDAAARSPPYSLLAHADSTATSHVLVARLQPLSDTDNIRVALDLLVDESVGAYPFGLVFQGNGDYRISLNLDPDRPGVGEAWNGSFPQHDVRPSPAPFPPGTWVHVELSVYRRASPSVELRVDGQLFGPWSLTSLDAGGASIVTCPCVLRLGLYYAGKGVTWHAHFDNVLVTTF
jgi:hypothetical protein